MAGSLKRELKSKYGIQPTISFAYGELEVLVDDRTVFSYKQAHRTPTVDDLLALIAAA